jgi:hypothetical protein
MTLIIILSKTQVLSQGKILAILSTSLINRHIARYIFILNGFWSITSQSFSTSVAMTSHKHKHCSWKTEVAKKFYKCSRLQMHVGCICAHWISTSVLWYLMDQLRNVWIWKKKQSLKINPGTQQKVGILNVKKNNYSTSCCAVLWSTCWSVLLVEETRIKPPTCRKSLTYFIT